MAHTTRLRKGIICSLGAILLLGAGPVPEPGPTPTFAFGPHVNGSAHWQGKVPWRDAAGNPLPFSSHEEVLEFLRTAEVIAREPLPNGITHPEKVLLEKDGLRVHAILRGYERRRDVALDTFSGDTEVDDLKDSGVSEAAAYELARMLGLPFIPPTVRRIVGNREGTLQLWIEDSMTARQHLDRGDSPPHADWWRGVMQTLAIFDNLVFNTDRHVGNLLIDGQWQVWFIDHTRAFQQERALRNPEAIRFSERHLWERLRGLSDDEIRAHLAPYLSGREIMALLARRERLVHHIEGLIDERGERAVLFDYSYDLKDWRNR